MKRAVAVLALSIFAIVFALVRPGTAAAAPWCGTPTTTNRPATVAGHQVRVVYAYPSDGVDRSASIAPAMWADVEAIQGWWTAQDPTRTPRIDVTGFPCGPQADVLVLRLPSTGADLAPIATRAERIVQGLPREADENFVTYLMYFDGPIDTPEVCGQGGGALNQPGIAIVYMQACIPTASRVVAAHELVHALGALPAGAPHPCPDSTGHPCDSTGDLMYPFIQTVDLNGYQLDIGRDDYYGHTGTWDDLQDSQYLRWNDRQVGLGVTVTGRGRVESDVPGLVCTARCTSEWNAGVAVRLAGTPQPGFKFRGFTGGCTGATCSLLLNSPLSVGAQFVQATFRLAVSVKGKGRVLAPAVGIACATTCARPVESLVPVRLRAAAAKGWRLKSWSGACKGTRAVCIVPMTKATAARAVFVRFG